VFEQFGGHAWAFPQSVNGNELGANLQIFNRFERGETIADPILKVYGVYDLVFEYL
jgi:Mor family transcriptional regulator